MSYYYTDPLAAAWMAKYFGIRLDYECSNMIMQNAAAQVYMALDVSQGGKGKFYIHPDSLGILEPQEGDLVQGDRDAKFIGKDDIEYIADSAWAFLVVIDSLPIDGEISIEGAKKCKIIQRQGISFMWPEIES